MPRMIITFWDTLHESDLHVIASAIISMQRIPADGTWPERTRVVTTQGIYTIEDTREDFDRNLAAWREAVSPKPAGG